MNEHDTRPITGNEEIIHGMLSWIYVIYYLIKYVGA